MSGGTEARRGTERRRRETNDRLGIFEVGREVLDDPHVRERVERSFRAADAVEAVVVVHDGQKVRLGHSGRRERFVRCQ